MKFPIFDNSWNDILQKEFQKPYFQSLMNFVDEERQQYTIFPKEEDVFDAFVLTPFDAIKVVIIGQDPYHGVGQAHGLAFSVLDGIKFPPSLQNIFKELKTDVGKMIPQNGNLEQWAKQGVLLLNATLTVRENLAGSHQKKGWEEFTNAIISAISQHKEGVVFLLWGRFAQEKISLIDAQKHHILCAAHPSPLSAYHGFFGCKHFSQTNEFLKQEGEKIIEW